MEKLIEFIGRYKITIIIGWVLMVFTTTAVINPGKEWWFLSIFFITFIPIYLFFIIGMFAAIIFSIINELK